MIFIQLIGYTAKCICQTIFQTITGICTKENSYSHSYNKDEQQGIFCNPLCLFIEITSFHVLNNFKHHKYSSLTIDTT